MQMELINENQLDQTDTYLIVILIPPIYDTFMQRRQKKILLLVDPISTRDPSLNSRV